MDVGNVSAAVLACGLWIEIGDGGEETTGEFGIEVMAGGYNFFRNLTDTQSSIKCPQSAIFWRFQRILQLTSI